MNICVFAENQPMEDIPCQILYKCVNCEGEHSCRYPKCSVYIQEVEIQGVKVTEKISYIDAKKVGRTPTPGISYSHCIQSTSTPAIAQSLIKELIPQFTHLINTVMNDVMSKYCNQNVGKAVSSVEDIRDAPVGRSSVQTSFVAPVSYTSDSSYSINRDKRKAEKSPIEFSDDTDESFSSNRGNQVNERKKKPGWPKGRKRKPVEGTEISGASSASQVTAPATQQHSSKKDIAGSQQQDKNKIKSLDKV